MSCLNMLSNEQQQVLYGGPTMGPRISFSSDFTHDSKHENSYREPPVSSDFEFSISGNSMISADEVFFKGKLLPLKESCGKITTLKDELLLEDEDEEGDVFSIIPKSYGRWKERLGLRRGQNHINNIGSNKGGEEILNLSPFSLQDKKGVVRS
ncbi:uncharacterized protein LOC124941548 [Impatiens glandulifera]|uniref:uncharacterized protein LOC124941548 n=1 Tax=Impatiens glandulifera TaxID=253017 RepID=UPI001FB114C7|nr:uncharacterized protein LOC124941548 [Impatiens glandulifera]